MNKEDMKSNNILTLLVIGILSISLTNFTQAQAVIGPDLQNTLNTATESVEVIITFWGNEAPDSGELSILNDAGISVGYSFQSLPMAGAVPRDCPGARAPCDAPCGAIQAGSKIDLFK